MTNKYLVLVPFNLPWEWSTDYTNQTAIELAKRGNVVICYMWSEKLSLREYLRLKKPIKIIGRIDKNLYVYYPILYFPFRRFDWVLKINEYINISILKLFMFILGLKNKFKYKLKYKLFWTFDPRTEYLIAYFPGWKVIFDCVDFFVATGTGAKEKRDLLIREESLVKSADLVTANSQLLQKYLEKYGVNVKLVPQGFRVDSFEVNKSKKTKIIKRGRRPLIGFLGAVDNRLDYNLLYKLVEENPNWDFAIWGPVLEKNLLTQKPLNYLEELRKLPNVVMGESPKEEVPGIIRQFDVGIIPYDIRQDFNKYCYPMKLFEYFYLGKPVVSTKIVELERFPDLVKISNNFQEWQKIIEGFLSRPLSGKLKSKAKRLAIANSWSNKVGNIIKIIDSEI